MPSSSFSCTTSTISYVLFNVPVYLVGLACVYHILASKRIGQPPSKLIVAISLGVLFGFATGYLLMAPVNNRKEACVASCVKRPLNDQQRDDDVKGKMSYCVEFCQCQLVQSYVVGFLFALDALVVYVVAKRVFAHFATFGNESAPSLYSLDEQLERRRHEQDNRSVVSEPLPAYDPKRESSLPPPYACDSPDYDVLSMRTIHTIREDSDHLATPPPPPPTPSVSPSSSPFDPSPIQSSASVTPPLPIIPFIENGTHVVEHVQPLPNNDPDRR